MPSWTLEDVAAHWDSSPEYDAQNAHIDSYFRRFTDSAPLFEIPTDATVLDIDCRTGNGTVFFQKRYPTARFTCIAMAKSFVERAKNNLKKQKIAAPVTQMLSKTLPFDAATFDVILTFETLEHVPWPKEYIAELSRILKPHGIMILTTPNVLWEPVHWLSATLHLDHGEGPHRMVPRKEILRSFKDANLHVKQERTFVLIPAGPKWLLHIGYTLEKLLPERLLRIVALRRTYICRKIGNNKT